MFIEQSTGRRRAVRMLFVMVVVAPCAALVTAAWWRHSAGHVAAVAKGASAYLGLPVSVGAVVHPRPGVLRLTQVVVGGTGHGDALVLPQLEVETAAGETRVRVPRLECSPGAARMVAGIAGEWLGRPERFPDAWVVDIGEVTWLPAEGIHETPLAGWHLECVAVDGSRALRCRREPASADEFRVRMTPEGCVVDGSLHDPVPVAILAGFLPGLSRWADVVGDRAVVRGRFDGVFDAHGWTGTLAGSVEHAALRSLVAPGGEPVRGEATIAATLLRWNAGRIVAGDVLISASAGALPQRVLDGLVSSFGCRPGPAYRSIGGNAVRRFDQLRCRLVLDGGALHLRAVEGSGGSLVGAQGLSLVDEPATAVPATRIAWFLSPEGRPAVPASPTSAWLMSVLPEKEGF